MFSTIHIQRESFPYFIDHLPDLSKASQLVLISHPSLMRLYGSTWKKILDQSSLPYFILEIPEGEQSKSLKQASTCWRFFIKHQIDRHASFLAFGGGVICDLVGFVGSHYLRGVTTIYIPTTLMAMVDAAIGGKTGINSYGKKNVIGTFYAPKAILIDSSFLKTLPTRELRSGLAEVIKYGVIADPFLFQLLIQGRDAFKNPASDQFDSLIKQCVQIKQSFIASDPHETTGQRALLNYGHSFGHALESLTRFQTYSHGEAVAIGMHCAATLSALMGLTNQEVVQNQAQILQQFDLPIFLPSLSIAHFIRLMKSDKKNQDGKLNLILLKKIGKVLKVTNVDSSLVKKCLSKCFS